MYIRYFKSLNYHSHASIYRTPIYRELRYIVVTFAPLIQIIYSYLLQNPGLLHRDSRGGVPDLPGQLPFPNNPGEPGLTVQYKNI